MDLYMYKLFQVCLTPEHIRTINPTFTPLDNRHNPFPDLREYHCFGMLLNSNLTNELDMWGMFSPKWSNKLKYPLKQVTTAVESNPGFDVYLFNHARVTDALTTNVWENSEKDHPGILNIMKKALELTGNDPKVLTMPTSKTTCYSSCFVATREFWNEYLPFITGIKEVFDNKLTDEERAVYAPNGTTIFPYIIERLLSTFLSLKNYNVYKHPYDFSVYAVDKKEKDFFMKLFKSLSGMKEHALSSESEEFYEYWDSFRQVTNMQFPTITDLDE